MLQFQFGAVSLQIKMFAQSINRCINYRCVEQCKNYLKQITVEHQRPEKPPLNYTETAQQQQNRCRIHKLGSKGGKVIPYPKVFPLCNSFPEMKHLNIKKLCQQICRQRGSHGNKGKAENMFKGGIFHRRPGRGRSFG